MNYEEIKRIASECFTCNPATGEVLRRVANNRGPAGIATGHLMLNGYMAVTLPSIRRKVYCHHVVFYLERGVWAPEEGMMIDHINTKRNDNRICNLRLADVYLNAYNTLLPTGSSPYQTKLGVRYRSQIKVGGVRTERAGFLTPEDAAEWYRSEKLRRLPELVGQGVRA